MLTTVRRATLKDVDFMAGIPAQQFMEYLGRKTTLYNKDYTKKLLNVLVKEHYVIVAEKAGKIVGGLGAVIQPHFWNPNLLVATECFWWVNPECRGGRIGYQLLTTYSQFIKDHPKLGGGHLSTLARSDIKEESLAKLGFKLMEHTFLMEKDF